MVPSDSALATQLIQEELFDLTLYQQLHLHTKGDLHRMLGELVPVEKKHVQFWRDFFKRDDDRLDAWNRFRLWAIIGTCRLFGEVAVQLVLEAIEIRGIRKYLEIWRRYKDEPLGKAVHEVLNDELEHEDEIVSSVMKLRIDPDSVRSIFLGFNDGMVEILGAISGFFAAFGKPHMVLIASSCVSVAGAISMAAGAFVGASSQREVQRIEKGKGDFLGGRMALTPEARPLRDAVFVGASYFLGAIIPALPMALGAQTLWASLIVAGFAILFVSAVLAFLSGMDARKRALTNLVIIVFAVAISYAIGRFADRLWGISI